MRSSILNAAIFAAGVISTPIIQQRGVVTDVVVVTITDYVYAGVGGLVTVQAPNLVQSPAAQGIEHHHKPTTTPVAAPVSSPALAPASPAPATTAAPPPPPPTSSAAAPPPPATTATSSAPTTIDPNLSESDPQYAALAVQHHNVHRANHSAAAVEWNNTLATWAQNKAAACVYDETFPQGVSGVGMNIAQGTFLYPGDIAGVISNMWYNAEVSHYPAYGVANLDTSEAAGFNDWGHMSQVVWKGTESIGCGSAQCGAGTSIGSGYFVACMYYPPGKSYDQRLLIVWDYSNTNGNFRQFRR